MQVSAYRALRTSCMWCSLSWAASQSHLSAATTRFSFCRPCMRATAAVPCSRTAPLSSAITSLQNKDHQAFVLGVGSVSTRPAANRASH